MRQFLPDPLIQNLHSDQRYLHTVVILRNTVFAPVVSAGQAGCLILKLMMARSGMRVGELLKLRAKNIEDRKAIIHHPKSGKNVESVFLP